MMGINCYNAFLGGLRINNHLQRHQSITSSTLQVLNVSRSLSVY